MVLDYACSWSASRPGASSGWAGRSWAGLLWKIRTKLILSYLFVAVVPLVLLSLLFFLAGLLFSGLVGSYVRLVGGRPAGHGAAGGGARGLVVPPAAAARAGAASWRRRAPCIPTRRSRWSAHGQVWARAGEAPRALPAWWKGPGFAGLVLAGERECLRAVWTEGSDFLALEVPVDDKLFEDLDRRMGVSLLQVGRPGGVAQERDHASRCATVPPPRRTPPPGGRKIAGVPSWPRRTAWSGRPASASPSTLIFAYRPWDLVQRLSPGSLNTADILTKALAALAVIFAVVYCVALIMGLLLARSITRSVHALSRGHRAPAAGRLRPPIRVHSRDQLGELADSFNMMARGIEDLLRESGGEGAAGGGAAHRARDPDEPAAAGRGAACPGCAWPRSAFPRRRWAATTTTCCRSRTRGWACWWPTSRARAPRPRSTWRS